MYYSSLNKKECKGGQRSCRPDYAVLESHKASTQLLQATLTRYCNINRYLNLSLKNKKIDDVRIYNYALTAEQIRQDYNKGLVRIGKGRENE